MTPTRSDSSKKEHASSAPGGTRNAIDASRSHIDAVDCTHAGSAPAEPAIQSPEATGPVLEVLRRLEAAHGPLVLHQSGGCCDGTAPMCVGRDELPPGPGDILLGELGGVPFYIDADQYARWGRPRFVIDVAPGDTGSFSLEGTLGVHFVTHTKATGT